MFRRQEEQSIPVTAVETAEITPTPFGALSLRRPLSPVVMGVTDAGTDRRLANETWSTIAHAVRFYSLSTRNRNTPEALLEVFPC